MIGGGAQPLIPPSVAPSLEKTLLDLSHGPTVFLVFDSSKCICVRSSGGWTCSRSEDVLDDAEVEEYKWLGDDESGDAEAEDATVEGIVREGRAGRDGRSWTVLFRRSEGATKDGQGG